MRCQKIDRQQTQGRDGLVDDNSSTQLAFQTKQSGTIINKAFDLAWQNAGQEKDQAARSRLRTHPLHDREKRPKTTRRSQQDDTWGKLAAAISQLELCEAE